MRVCACECECVSVCVCVPNEQKPEEINEISSNYDQSYLVRS